jgi:uncharacterized protein GlcG (DUF336 family)
MPELTLSSADTLAHAALATARELQLRPIAIVVLDAGGNVCLIHREDHAGLLRVDIAHAKAWGTLGMGVGGARLTNHAKRDPVFFTALTAISAGRITSSRGGVLIRDSSSDIIGAVGISGDHPDNDEVCAVAGIQAANLTPDTGEDTAQRCGEEGADRRMSKRARSS